MNEIILGDTLEMLKTIEDNVFDMGVTSPPYNKQNNRKGVLVKDIKYSNITDNKNESEYQIEQIEILNELYRTIKPGGSFFYNHKIRWDKGEMWQVEERIYWLYKPLNKKDNGEELKSKHALLTSVWRLRPEMNKTTVSNHPAPFPIEIPTRCIYSILDDKTGCNIIDPYMGSGTLAVVCKLLGHNYFGIDISEEYITNANNRVNNISEKEITDFNTEIQKHKVNKTYKERKLEKGK